MTMLRSRIIGLGSFLPDRISTNDDMAKIVDTSDEWIVTRTGIRQRHSPMKECLHRIWQQRPPKKL